MKKALIHLFFIACGLTLVVPLIAVAVISFTPPQVIEANGLTLFPGAFTADAYFQIMGMSVFWRMLGMSLLYTAAGCLGGTVICGLYAYAISRQSFPGRRFFTLMCLFCIFITPGALLQYMSGRELLHITNTPWGVLLPLLVNPVLILILACYLRRAVPEALLDAARLDGCGEYRALWSIALPLVKPGIITLLFCNMAAFWTDWVNSDVMIRARKDFSPLAVGMNNLLIRFVNDPHARPAPTINAVMYLPHPWEIAPMLGGVALIMVVPLLIGFLLAQKHIRTTLSLGVVKELTRQD